jgi:hypothetical protein
VDRSYSPVAPAFAAIAVVFAFVGCVNLTRPLSLQPDAGSSDGRVASDTGEGGGGTLGPDAGGGGSAGNTAAATGGSATGGTSPTATGGTGGSIMVDADPEADAAAMPGTEAGEIVPTDAPAVADAASFQDVGIDVPLPADARVLPDSGSGGSDVVETGTLDAPGADTRDGPAGGADGASDLGTDAPVAPIIISIDFVGGQPTGTGVFGVVAMDPNEIAGVKRAAHWNSAPGETGSLTALVSSSGSATAASANWSVPEVGGQSTWSNSFTDAPGDPRMMNGYLDPRAADQPGTVSVANLPAEMSSGYDVYVYCYSAVESGDTRNYQYTIGSTTVSVSQPALTTSSFPGYTQAIGGDGGTAGAGDYVVFRNVTGSGFTLTAQPRPSTWGMQRAPVNGLQIVYPSGS